MITRVVEINRKSFLQRKADAHTCPGPVTPHIQQNIGKLIIQSQKYQDLVSFVPNKDFMEALVSISQYAAVQRRVIFQPKQKYLQPAVLIKTLETVLRAYGVAEICLTNGSLNVHIFIPE